MLIKHFEYTHSTQFCQEICGEIFEIEDDSRAIGAHWCDMERESIFRCERYSVNT